MSIEIEAAQNNPDDDENDGTAASSTAQNDFGVKQLWKISWTEAAGGAAKGSPLGGSGPPWTPQCLQLLQRPDSAAIDQLAFIPGQGIAMKRCVQIMDHQRINRIQCQPLQRLFIGPHETVIGIAR